MTRSSLPVYIVRSKVDHKFPGAGGPLANLTQPKARDASVSNSNSETGNTSGSSKMGSDIGSQGIGVTT